MNSLRLSYRFFPLIMAVIVICLSLIGSHILISLSYAQNGSIQKKTSTNMLAKSKLQGIKITFPAQGQKVSDAKNLTITGTSTYNSHTNCQVSIIVNNIRPYQHAIATGHNGTNDYSTWKFPLNPKYITIKAGLSNKATAKLTCNDKPISLTKFYSINFTSVSTSASTPQAQLHTLNNNSYVATSTKNKTELLSIIGKQNSNKPINPSVSSAIDNHNKMTSDQQKTPHNYTTTESGIGTHDNKISIKPESTTTPQNSVMCGTNSPFALPLPSLNNNSSSSSTSPELQSESHSKNNDGGSRHH